MQKHRFEAIGTWWSIETPQKLSASTRKQVARRIEEFDQNYSRFRHDSLVEKLRKPGVYHFPDDVRPLVDFYRDLYTLTKGAVSPLVGSALDGAGYDASYSLQPSTPPKVALAWEDAMVWHGNEVTVKKPIIFDCGAAGKGYLVDLIGQILEENDIKEYVIDASGDIRHRGVTWEVIGLENPHDTAKVIGTLPLQNASLCASSSNRRRWAGTWHHVLDARTGMPTNEVVATWVLAKSTMVADGLATSLFFVHPNKLKQYDCQAIRLMADGALETSDNFVGELFA